MQNPESPSGPRCKLDKRAVIGAAILAILGTVVIAVRECTEKDDETEPKTAIALQVPLQNTDDLAEYIPPKERTRASAKAANLFAGKSGQTPKPTPAPRAAATPEPSPEPSSSAGPQDVDEACDQLFEAGFDDKEGAVHKALTAAAGLIPQSSAGEASFDFARIADACGVEPDRLIQKVAGRAVQQGDSRVAAAVSEFLRDKCGRITLEDDGSSPQERQAKAMAEMDACPGKTAREWDMDIDDIHLKEAMYRANKLATSLLLILDPESRPAQEELDEYYANLQWILFWNDNPQILAKLGLATKDDFRSKYITEAANALSQKGDDYYKAAAEHLISALPLSGALGR